jgi:2-succinyl-6-hydroxy-2,4-cyclohexadiene-1-carboxylate synthase
MTAPPPLMRMFATRIRNAEFVVVPNVGHSAYWEDPESFNRALLDFMRRH